MESDIIVSLIKNGGIVGALTILFFIIKLFMNGKDKKNGNGGHVFPMMPEYQDSIKRTLDRVSDLHKWHQADDSGVQEWKNPNLAEAIEKLTNSIVESTKLNAEAALQHTEAHRRIVDTLEVLIKSGRKS